MIIQEYVDTLIEEKRNNIINEGIISNIFKVLSGIIFIPYAIVFAILSFFMISSKTEDCFNKNRFKKFINKNPEFLNNLNKISNNINKTIIQSMNSYNSRYFIINTITDKNINLYRSSSESMLLSTVILNLNDDLLVSELTEYSSTTEFYTKYYGDGLEEYEEELDKRKIEKLSIFLNDLDKNINIINSELHKKYTNIKISGDYNYEKENDVVDLMRSGIKLEIRFNPKEKYKLDPNLNKEITKQFNIFKNIISKRSTI